MAQMKKAGRREAGANTRDALLKASAELIQENGMRPISLRDTADRADMNQAMVRYHFGDKDGLMKAVLDHGSNSFSRVFRKTAGSRRRYSPWSSGCGTTPGWPCS